MMTACIAILTAAAASGFLFLRLWDAHSAPPIVVEDPRPNASIAVSVEGAVATPGVYHLRGDARVQEAIDAAGGTISRADIAQINPAARLHDEERLVVPTAVVIGSTDHGAVPVATSDGAGSSTEPIDINTASAEMLDTLPGIGPALAGRIVAYREANGPFRSVDELAEVDGISLAMVDEMRSLITV